MLGYCDEVVLSYAAAPSFTRVGRYGAPHDDDVLIATSMGVDGTVGCLFASEEAVPLLAHRDVLRGFTYALAQNTPSPVDVTLTTLHGDITRSSLISSLELAHPRLALTPRGILIASASSRATPTGGTPNAVLLRPDSLQRPVATVCLGDGISTMVATSSHLYVGFLEEGLVGGMGWGGHTGPRVFGRYGVRCLPLPLGAEPLANEDVEGWPPLTLPIAAWTTLSRHHDEVIALSADNSLIARIGPNDAQAWHLSYPAGAPRPRAAITVGGTLVLVTDTFFLPCEIHDGVAVPTRPQPFVFEGPPPTGDVAAVIGDSGGVTLLIGKDHWATHKSP